MIIIHFDTRNLTYWPLLRSKDKIYIIEQMSRFGTGYTTRRRTASTGSVPPSVIIHVSTTRHYYYVLYDLLDILNIIQAILFADDTANIIQAILFADDTAVYHSSSNMQSLFLTMNNELDILTNWFRDKLLMYEKRTFNMLFTNSDHHIT